MISLSDLIEEDYHQTLIAEGNLRAAEARRSREALERAKASQWQSKGYSARILREVCKSCKGRNAHVLGVFHDEQNGLGDTRSTSLSANYQIPSLREIIAEEVFVPHCAACLREIFLK